jgi:hypothetical protein
LVPDFFNCFVSTIGEGRYYFGSGIGSPKHREGFDARLILYVVACIITGTIIASFMPGLRPGTASIINVKAHVLTLICWLCFSLVGAGIYSLFGSPANLTRLMSGQLQVLASAFVAAQLACFVGSQVVYNVEVSKNGAPTELDYYLVVFPVALGTYLLIQCIVLYHAQSRIAFKYFAMKRSQALLAAAIVTLLFLILNVSIFMGALLIAVHRTVPPTELIPPSEELLPKELLPKGHIRT